MKSVNMSEWQSKSVIFEKSKKIIKPNKQTNKIIPNTKQYNNNKVIKRKKLPSGEGDASGSSDSGELSEAGESDQVEAENILILF